MREVILNDVIHEFEEAESFSEIIKGLRFRKEGKMFFQLGETVNLIDMFFVPVPLQLIFINSEKEVVKVKKAEPWGIYISPVEASYLLETTDFVEVEEGDKVKFRV